MQIYIGYLDFFSLMFSFAIVLLFVFFFFLQDESYREVLRQLLHLSDDQFEVWLVAKALGDYLTPLETLAVEVITTVHRTLPDLITLPPQSV